MEVTVGSMIYMDVHFVDTFPRDGLKLQKQELPNAKNDSVFEDFFYKIGLRNSQMRAIPHALRT